MKRMLIVLGLVVLAGSGFAARQVVLTCDADTYVSLDNPDTNYGTALTLNGTNEYTIVNGKYTTFSYNTVYLHFPIPANLVGKVKVVNVGQYYYAELVKTKSPYPASDTIVTGLLRRARSSWTETGLSYNNQPYTTTPILFEADSSKGNYNPKVGWNKFLFTHDGIIAVQDTFERPKSNFGGGIVFNIFGPDSAAVYADGTYIHLFTISSRETVKRSPYMVVEYEWKSGVKPAASEIQTMSLGEVKATYR